MEAVSTRGAEREGEEAGVGVREEEREEERREGERKSERKGAGSVSGVGAPAMERGGGQRE
eukprot:3941939-Rhodomonas_salina.5